MKFTQIRNKVKMLLTELNMLILQFVVLIFLFTIFTVLHIYKMFFLNTIIYNIYTVSVMLLVVVEVVLGRVGQIGQGRMGMGRRMVGSDGHSWSFLLCSSSVCKMTTQIGLSGTKERTDEDKSKLWEKDKNSRYPA